MIIGKDFVFLHVPKCAGSSFCKMMKERHGYNESFDPHSTAVDIPEEHRDKFIFGFMRDPVKQEASNFFYHTQSWKGNVVDMEFENWCEWRFAGHDMHWSETWIKKADLRQYGYDFNFTPQAGYFCDENGLCIADRIFRQEDMKEATAELTERLGLDCDLLDYHVLDTSNHVAKRPVITDRCRELIYDAKHFDFDLHGDEGPIRTNYTFAPIKSGYAYEH